MTQRYRGRFAPSPTGVLHLGNARTALLAWLAARSHGGDFVVRMEDLDTPRVAPGVAQAQLEDLAWLGLDWDEGPDVGGPRGPYTQSQRLPHYAAAVTALLAQGRAYACTCSRKDLERTASAPHPGEEGPRYPGTCKGRYTNREDAAQALVGKSPAVRFAVDAGQVRFQDEVQGTQQQDVVAQVGDVVIQRADGLYAYQLAVVVDDLAMGITHVVRAQDLVFSTPRQLLLMRALGGSPPQYAHVPVMHAPHGQRLQKREPQHTVVGLRQAGVSAAAVVGFLAHSVGLLPRSVPMMPAQLVEDFSLRRVREATRWDLLPVTS